MSLDPNRVLALFLLASSVSAPDLSLAQGAAALPAIVEGVKDKVCTLDGIPVKEGRITPTNKEHRVHLYLRCELKGIDEFVSQSCCEHLTAGDSSSIGRCPTTPAGGAWMAVLRQMARCY